MIKQISATIFLVACFGATTPAQSNVPLLLIRAGHCLAVKNFLPPSNAGKLTLGYVLDEHSYPGEKVIYIVAFADSARSNGSVFTVFLTTKDGRDGFNIQNNASFVLSKQEPIGVSFVNPPLGGTWTQEHLATAIREIEKKPRFTIPSENLLVADPWMCESYTDQQPKTGKK